MPRPCCVRGRRRAPKDMMPASVPAARKKIRSRSLRRYQKRVLLIDFGSCYRSIIDFQTSDLRQAQDKGYTDGVIAALFDWLFPWSCAVCRVGYEGRGTLCEDCFDALRKLEQEPHCDTCAMPLPMVGSPCPYCKGKG